MLLTLSLIQDCIDIRNMTVLSWSHANTNLSPLSSSSPKFVKRRSWQSPQSCSHPWYLCSFLQAAFLAVTLCSLNIKYFSTVVSAIELNYKTFKTNKGLKYFTSLRFTSMFCYKHTHTHAIYEIIAIMLFLGFLFCHTRLLWRLRTFWGYLERKRHFGRRNQRLYLILVVTAKQTRLCGNCNLHQAAQKKKGKY